jgi:uncharacterized Fe-S center protein
MLCSAITIYSFKFKRCVKMAHKIQPSKVYFGSVSVTKPEAKATLPAKTSAHTFKDKLEKLCQGEWVPIKMHLGGGLGYTTIHPVFVRVIAEAVKDAAE